MADYEMWAKRECPNKLPQWGHADHRIRLGDALYDFSNGVPIQRAGVHGANNYSNDLSGEAALLSKHFYYFGDKPVTLLKQHQIFVKDGRGHKVVKNAQSIKSFIKWLEGLGYLRNVLIGNPQIDLFNHKNRYSCDIRAACNSDNDEINEDEE